MFSSKLLNVPIKVLRADLVERAFVGALQHRPERFDPVDMGHPVHEFRHRVLDRFVIWKMGIGGGVIGVDCRAIGDVIQHEALQSLCVGVSDHLRRNLIARPILRAYDSRLANRPASLKNLRLAFGMFRRLPPK